MKYKDYDYDTEIIALPVMIDALSCYQNISFWAVE